MDHPRSFHDNEFTLPRAEYYCFTFKRSSLEQFLEGARGPLVSPIPIDFVDDEPCLFSGPKRPSDRLPFYLSYGGKSSVL